jgi:hypothetical protein
MQHTHNQHAQLHTQPSQPAPTTLPGGGEGNSICTNAQGHHWRARGSRCCAHCCCFYTVATATVSLLPILVDCCLCPRPSLLQPLSSPPTAVAVTVVVFVVVIIVIIVVVVVIVVVAVIVVIMFAVIVFVVLIVLVIVFTILVIVVVVFVMFIVVIVVVSFIVVNKLLSPLPPCLYCQF